MRPGNIALVNAAAFFDPFMGGIYGCHQIMVGYQTACSSVATADDAWAMMRGKRQGVATYSHNEKNQMLRIDAVKAKHFLDLMR
jgi:hypothetical protein